jgi:hypothetical protein
MTQQAGLPCPIRLFGIQTFLESGQRWAWLKPGAGEANRKSAPSSCAEAAVASLWRALAVQFSKAIEPAAT